jgi:glyoxylase-like metal-dependent hydrolase (beta-lactamase superfamily II)/rhodanese-related sulfurtransferase
VLFQPYYLGCLSHASYLVGEEGGDAAVVDPQRDVDAYLAHAKAAGCTIRHVFLTHFHADFVSGHLELAARTGAAIHVGARARTEYPSVPMRDGEHVDLGSVRLSFLETPGHTPESVCIVVTDRSKGDAPPYAVLTGDTMFVGDVGRPDLMASVGMTSESLAGMLYDSLHEKLLRLPDATLVYPAHGAGSMCGKNLSSETFSTIGVQKRTNCALRPATKQEFVALLTSDQPEAPAYFGFDADLNRRRRPTLDEALAREDRALTLDEVLAKQAAGATVLDAREPTEYAAGHLKGSVNVGLSGRYASWAGVLLDPRTPIVLVTAPGKERESGLRLGRIGFDAVVGHLRGGASAWASRPDVVRRWPRIGPSDFVARLGAATPPAVLDVRTKAEWEAGHVEGSVNVPLQRLASRLAEVPRGKPLVIHCQTGYRSSIAASLLANAGFTDFVDLAAGYVGYLGASAAFAPPAL